jgi:iron complex outermembrane receptor protein
LCFLPESLVEEDGKGGFRLQRTKRGRSVKPAPSFQIPSELSLGQACPEEDSMRFSFLVLFFALFLCLGSIPLFADDDELSFVVTAGRIPEEADSVPAQVTVITADDIAASGASSLVEVLGQVPGLRFTGAASGPGSESVSMRGFGENSYGRVLVLVDGNRLNNPDMKGINWNAVPLADIERIEVLDGAASVRYGNNAVGGVINIITKKSGATRTSVTVSAGAFTDRVRPEDREAFSHFRTTKWGDFSIAVEHLGTKGYRDRQAARTLNAAVQGTVNLTDTLSLSLRVSLANLDYRLPGGLSKADYEDDPTRALRDDYSLFPAANYVPNWGDEASELHYSGGIGLQWFPNEILELQFPLSYTGKFIEIDMASYPSYTDRTVHTGEGRPQVSATFDIAGMSLRLLGGVDFYYAYLCNDIYSDKPRTTKTVDVTTTEFSLGPYLTVRFDPLENLTVTAGGRFDTAFVSAKKSASSSGVLAENKNKNWTAFVYDAGISFRPIDGLKLYAAYGTLFRYPFTDELASYYGSTMDYFNPDLKPEKGFNVEGGAGWTFGNIVAVNGNVYYTQLEDEIAYTTHNVNLNKTRRIGTSIGLTLSLIRYLELSGAYSFVDAIFIDGANKDKHVPLVPAHTVYGTLTGKLPFGLQLGPTVEYRSESYQGGDNANNLEKVDDYVLFGAFLRYTLDTEDRTLSIQLVARNLLNTRYSQNVFNDGYGGPSAYYPGDGRSITASVSYRF